MDISVVVPVYGCRAAVRELYRRLTLVLQDLVNDYEIILVNDACPQGSWEVIEQICQEDTHVVGLELARNFGQIRAITAGLDYSKGNYVVVMDCDLQDRPEGIAMLYQKLQEGYDVVFARRQDRKDSAITKLLSKAFYKVYDYFTDGVYDNSICNFSISRREVIQKYCQMREQNRAYTLFLKWLGFRQVAIDMPADARYEGKSSYNLKKKFKMAAEFVTAQSNKPLWIAIKIGFLLAVCSILFMAYQVLRYFFSGTVPTGWTSLIVSLYFLGGVQLFFLGVIGIYVGYIFNEVKDRPLYVIRTTLNYERKEEKR